MSDKITLFQKWLRESDDKLKKYKQMAKKVQRYYEGDQLDEIIKKILADRGQPEQYENNVEKFANKLIGYNASLQREIKIFPTQREDRDKAIILNDIIRHITDTTTYEVEQELSDWDLIFAGVAIQEVLIKENRDKIDRFGRSYKDIVIKNAPLEEMYLDPFSKEPDYSDARYIHRVFWTDRENLYLHFDEKKVDLLDNSNQIDYQDEDNYENRDRVLLCYTWYKEVDRKAKKLVYKYAFWSGSTILLEGESPFNFKGFPFIVQKLHKKSKNFYGVFKSIIPLIDSINHKKLRLANMLGSVKVVFNGDAVEDSDEFVESYQQDNSVTEVKDIHGIKEIKQTTEIAQLLQVILDERNQIKEILGLNDEFLASTNVRLSGEAIQQRLNVGSIGFSLFVGASVLLQQNTIKKVVELIKQYYDAERTFLIVEEDLASRYFAINEAIEEQGEIKFKYEDGYKMPVAKNSLADIDEVDLKYRATPKPLTSSNERYRQNTELIKTLAQISPNLVPLILPELLKDAESPVADKVREIIENASKEKKDPQETQAQLMQLQATLKEKEAKIKKLESEAILNFEKAKHLGDKSNLDFQKAFGNFTLEEAKINVKREGKR